ncbi:MAG: hypothetical protein JWN27_2918 [Candidatus Eremiobacteraeota bacterium]|nr:hypothetical protein [Candidatus Eremiobacteraeota bacterium]
MTESATRKRATLFMRELGTADAAAGMPPRESEALKALLIDAITRLCGGQRWTLFVSSLNAYHPAHRRAKRNLVDGVEERGWSGETGETVCVACSVVVADAASIANHVGSIAHLARAEGAAAKARAARLTA